MKNRGKRIFNAFIVRKNQWKHNTLYVIIEAMMVIYKCCLSTDLAYAVQYDDIVSHCSTMCIKIGRAHVWTPVTDVSRMPSSAWKKKKKKQRTKS